MKKVYVHPEMIVVGFDAECMIAVSNGANVKPGEGGAEENAANKYKGVWNHEEWSSVKRWS